MFISLEVLCRSLIKEMKCGVVLNFSVYMFFLFGHMNIYFVVARFSKKLDFMMTDVLFCLRKGLVV